MTSPRLFCCEATDLPLDIIASCDVQIIDPPFAEHVHERATSIHSSGRGVENRDLGFEPITPELRRWIALVAGAMTRWSIVFSDLESTHLWRDAMAARGIEYVRETPCLPGEALDGAGILPAYWPRWAQPQMSGDRPPSSAEAVLTFHAMSPRGPRGGKPKPLAKHWNGDGGLMAWQARAMRGRFKHDCEKPIDLMLSLVSAFSDPGERVLDMCAGAGTTLLAARLLDREALGCERDPAWAEYGQARALAALDARDSMRVDEWCDATLAAAERVAEPRDASERPRWERAQRRIADVLRVRRNAA